MRVPLAAFALLLDSKTRSIAKANYPEGAAGINASAETLSPIWLADGAQHRQLGASHD